MTTRSKIRAAFAVLRANGYFARMNFWCCQACGCAAIPNKNANSFVFFHDQDNTMLKNTGSCYLAWAGSGTEICDVLRGAGLNVEWDNSPGTRIQVS